MNRRARRAAAKNGAPPRLEDALPKISDPQCVACYITNESPIPLTFVSVLEQYYPRLIEAKAFVSFELKPKEKRLVPHSYFDILPHEAERKINVSAIPAGHEPVEFLYATRPLPPETELKSDIDLAAGEETKSGEAQG